MQGIEGDVDVPDGMQCIGIVGIMSNHNLTVTFGRATIEADGHWTVAAYSLAKYTDLTVKVTALLRHA